MKYISNIVEIKKREDKNETLTAVYNEVYKIIILKIIFYFILIFTLSFSFWIYLGCFCAVYKNTQIHLLKDVTLSFSISFIFPFFICILPGIFRILSLKKR